MGKLFSGSKTQKESNAAYGQIHDTFTPAIDKGVSSFLDMGKLLGGDSSGFDAYKKATGFDATAEMGSRGITGNQAASGLLRSGGTGKALQNYGQTLQNQYAGDYMGGLKDQANYGLGAADLLGKVATKKTKSKSKPGLGAVLGGGLSAFAGGA